MACTRRARVCLRISPTLASLMVFTHHAIYCDDNWLFRRGNVSPFCFWSRLLSTHPLYIHPMHGQHTLESRNRVIKFKRCYSWLCSRREILVFMAKKHIQYVCTLDTLRNQKRASAVSLSHAPSASAPGIECECCRRNSLQMCVFMPRRKGLTKRAQSACLPSGAAP